MSITRKCKIEGCNYKLFRNKNGNETTSQGLCITHYYRLKNNGTTSRITESHKMSNTSEYNTWAVMKDRCANIKNPAYSRYGGRGIKVCDRWLHSFVSFYKDMGAKPSSLHSIDRIDNNKGYSPENCRWATREVQSLNKRKLNIGRSVKIDNNLVAPSGSVQGVCYMTSKKMWRAYRSINGVRYDITARTKNEAYAYRKAFEAL